MGEGGRRASSRAGTGAARRAPPRPRPRPETGRRAVKTARSARQSREGGRGEVAKKKQSGGGVLLASLVGHRRPTSSSGHRCPSYDKEGMGVADAVCATATDTPRDRREVSSRACDRLQCQPHGANARSYVQGHPSVCPPPDTLSNGTPHARPPEQRKTKRRGRVRGRSKEGHSRCQICNINSTSPIDRTAP